MSGTELIKGGIVQSPDFDWVLNIPVENGIVSCCRVTGPKNHVALVNGSVWVL